MSAPVSVIRQFLAMQGYREVRKLKNGKLAGVMPQLYTAGLFVGLDAGGYERRYCYESMMQATEALCAWDGDGDPPGPWIKEKPSDRLGPGATSD